MFEMQTLLSFYINKNNLSEDGTNRLGLRLTNFYGMRPRDRLMKTSDKITN